MSGKVKSGIKFSLFVLLIIALIAAIKFFGLGEQVSVGNIKAFLDGIGIWAPIVFVLIYALMISFGIPGTIVTVVGGLVFGKWLGTLLNVIGATLGASGAFWIARLLARDMLIKKLSGKSWFEKFNKGLEENGVFYMLFVRLVPLFPFNGLNFGSGITKISYRDYLIGTGIGIIPGTFVFTNAAAELGESAAEGFKLTGGVVFAFVLLGLFALVPILIKRRLDRGSGRANPN